MVDMEAGAARGEAAGEASGEVLVLGFAGEREGERKLRSSAADGEEAPESRDDAGLGLALDLGFAFGFGLEAAAVVPALAFLMADGVGRWVGEEI